MRRSLLLLVFLPLLPCAPAPWAGPATEPDRSPVDVVLSADEQWLLTANQTSGTVSLVHVASGKVQAEVKCGARPSALALAPDGRHVLVSATFSGSLTLLRMGDGKLEVVATIPVGFEPRGIVFTPDGRNAYVALTTAHAIGIVDVEKRAMVDRIEVGRWPRYLALTADGKTLAVGTSGDGGICVVDVAARKVRYREEFSGMNLGEMQISADQKYVYFPWMVYRHNPITSGNIRLGWVLASRIARVRLDGPARREAFSLDPPGKAVSDPHGLALSPDGEWISCSASGTQELLVYKSAGLPLIDYGGTDHIDPQLLKDTTRFFRIPLGGRPMAVRYSRDGQRVYVANYLLNAVQVVEPGRKEVVRTIALGGPVEPSLARRGEAIFFDGRRSLDQWYSCHSCHYEGHTNAITMDTKNDGRFGNFKTVLSLRNVTRTGPWFWHGYEKDLSAAVRRSMVDTMLGKEPTDADVQALVAYFDTLMPPPNPNRGPDGALSPAAQRGAEVFRSEKASCARCHGGSHFTDGRVHDVASGERGDVYKGYNPPSLLGVYDRILYLHDGRARSLEEALRGPHSPGRVTGMGELSENELQDLLAYLRSL
jgi:DNA-binding beta-propeller fold protein YncE/mono/diheme cytochrome c family protein